MKRRFDRRPDGPDPRDRRFVPDTVLGFASTGIPDKIDLRASMPPAFDQGEEGSCGANSLSAFLCYLLPLMRNAGYSRQQIYYCVRVLEKTVNEDSGVETRNLFKVANKTGAAPEALWPYLPENLFRAPPASVLREASRVRVASYQRLVGEHDYITCLSSGFPFVLGFNVYSAFEGEEIERTGVMLTPDPKKEEMIGGHAVLAVGYDLKFRRNPAAQGVDAGRISNHALLIRNSWGTKWGIQGHFWMPMPFAVNPSTGGDAWTARL